MKNQLRIWLGSAIMILGVSLPTLEKMIVPVEPSVREVMMITKPSDEMIKLALPLDEVITKKSDEESFAVFNKEFSDRVVNYETKGQAVLGIYSTAIETVFGKRLKEDYDNKIGVVVKQAMEEVMGDYETNLTEKQRKDLQEKFESYSWVLGGDLDNE